MVVTNFYVHKTQSIKEIRKPESMIKYNLLARGVEKNNQLASFYFPDNRSVKWYKNFFFICNRSLPYKCFHFVQKIQ